MTDQAETPATRPPHAFRWDLDKTYLHTEFDTLLDIVRTAVEKPERKRTVAGAAWMIREVRAHTDARITIISGSPEQMRASIEAKLRLDGVQWDEFVLKPSLRSVLRFRFRALRDQVGYKLPALLAARATTPPECLETCFGDDAEADALVYSLYADILGGRVSPETLRAVMTAANSYPDVIEQAVDLAAKTPAHDPVRRIFINLERRSDPAFFHRYGARVVPVRNYFQAVLVLIEDGVLPAVSARNIVEALALTQVFSDEELAESAHELVRRGALSHASVTSASEQLAAGDEGHHRLAEVLARAPEQGEAPAYPEIDYVAALNDDRARWEEARAQARRK
ncbi:MAG: hypothetical protein R3A48_21650 [Polyangiales bacterium]